MTETRLQSHNAVTNLRLQWKIMHRWQCILSGFRVSTHVLRLAHSNSSHGNKFFDNQIILKTMSQYLVLLSDVRTCVLLCLFSHVTVKSRTTIRMQFILPDKNWI
mmetsp:Transcript_20789/g.57717  ORF Transcript_20789/g.57717 Transcript_20789/m.57717 type:complete len:105 (-) Transcript_20789:184-498(-)